MRSDYKKEPDFMIQAPALSRGSGRRASPTEIFSDALSCIISPGIGGPDISDKFKYMSGKWRNYFLKTP